MTAAYSGWCLDLDLIFYHVVQSAALACCVHQAKEPSRVALLLTVNECILHKYIYIYL